MSHLLPIVPHQCCNLHPDELEFARQTAMTLRRKRPDLQCEPLFQELMADRIEAAPSLHVDDFSSIQNAIPSRAFYQERARLRAIDGDVLATAMPQVDGYESYCRESLALGEVAWITPITRDNPLRLAKACWQDRPSRHQIIHQVRKHGLRYIHPHIGSRAVWELALLIRNASRRPVSVIAPPPAITQFANDKGEFSNLVTTMFGNQAIPAAAIVFNTACAAKRLMQLDASVQHVAIKLPSASGGAGNLLISMSEIRDRSLREVDELLHHRLPRLKYESSSELLVTAWMEDVLGSPSAQLWIPPLSQGTPILEGLFMQIVDPANTRFTGFGPATLPLSLKRHITRECLQVATVFQSLGYVGRCSIDMLLIGNDLEASQMKFIECNGRWGGTSLPMTMMNRIFGDWHSQPFSTRTLKIDGIDQFSFPEFMRAIGDQLYDCKTKAGRFVIFNPQQMAFRGELSVLGLHDTWTNDNEPFQRFRLQIESARSALTEPPCKSQG